MGALSVVLVARFVAFAERKTHVTLGLLSCEPLLTMSYQSYCSLVKRFAGHSIPNSLLITNAHESANLSS